MNDHRHTLHDFMMAPGGLDADRADDDGVFRAGTPLLPGDTPAASDDAIIEVLKTVYDPEIPVNIYELGLIYTIDRLENGNVDITMTLTAPGCPVAGILPGEVADKAADVEGVGKVQVMLTWDPPWDMTRMTDEARLTLDMF